MLDEYFPKFILAPQSGSGKSSLIKAVFKVNLTVRLYYLYLRFLVTYAVPWIQGGARERARESQYQCRVPSRR